MRRTLHWQKPMACRQRWLQGILRKLTLSDGVVTFVLGLKERTIPKDYPNPIGSMGLVYLHFTIQIKEL